MAANSASVSLKRSISARQSPRNSVPACQRRKNAWRTSGQACRARSSASARTASGQWLSGVAAFEVAYAAVGLGWVMSPARVPLLRAGMDALYPVIARNRYRAPAWVIRMFFGKALRRAAERAAAQQCTDQCAR